MAFWDEVTKVVGTAGEVLDKSVDAYETVFGSAKTSEIPSTIPNPAPEQPKEPTTTNSPANTGPDMTLVLLAVVAVVLVLFLLK